MKRILFVDDEPAVLAGLRNVLRGERKRWDTFFAKGGKEALAFMAERQFDLIVTDMRMPEMDGLTLLRKVRDLHPDVIRIVLTGYADLASVTRTSAIAHQHLLKPCEFSELRGVLERACALQDTFASESLRKMIGELGMLPSAPQAYQALTDALGDPDIELTKLASIVEQDVGMSSRVLQFVNTAYFGTTKHISSIESAILCLGVNALRHLALTFEVFSTFRGGTIGGITLEGLERHALLTARIARKLVDDPGQAETAFAAGLLHDAGRLVLMSRLPEPYGEAIERARVEKKPLHTAEKETIGADHAEVGAYLLGVWGLPHTIVEPVAFHHTPVHIASRPGNVATIFFADALAHEVVQDGTTSSPMVTPGEWEMLGSQIDLPAWRSLAQQEAMALAR